MAARDPLTPKQAAFLAILIRRSGKREYQEAKRRLGIAHLTIMRLDRERASLLIKELREPRNDHAT